MPKGGWQTYTYNSLETCVNLYPPGLTLVESLIPSVAGLAHTENTRHQSQDAVDEGGFDVSVETDYFITAQTTATTRICLRNRTGVQLRIH